MRNDRTSDPRPGTTPAPPRQAARRLLRYATALTGDTVAPASWEATMAESKLPAIAGPILK